MKQTYYSSVGSALFAVATLAMFPACAGTPAVTAKHKANAPAVFSGFRLGAEPQAGVPLDVVISYTVPAGEPVTVRYVPGSGLRIPQTPSEGALPTGQQSQTVTVVPLSQGSVYLDVFVAQGARTAVHTVPIHVGKASEPRVAGELKRAPDGEKLLTTPVR